MIIDQFVIDKANLPVGTYYRKMHDDLASEYVGLLGGDGPLALSIIREWIRSPYASKLRWACVRLMKMDVDGELKKTIERRRNEWNQSIPTSKAIQEIVALRSVHKLKRDVKAITARYPESREEIKRFLQDLEHVTTMQHKTYETWRLSASARVLDTTRAIIALSRALVSPTVALYRGICCEQASQIHRLMKDQKQIRITTDFVTSFTSELLTAKNFASMTAVRAVIPVEVNMDDIIACPEAFSALENEQEYITSTRGWIDVETNGIIT